MMGSRHKVITSQQPRAAFTLVELLVAMSIFVVLASLTVTGFQSAANSDRVGEAASTVRAKLEGARSRAIKAKAPRGVRLMIDPPNSSMGPVDSLMHRTITSIAYLDAPEYIEGVARVEYLNQNVPVTPSREYNGNAVNQRWTAFSSIEMTSHDPDPNNQAQVPYHNWYQLHQDGLITPGSRLVIGGESYRLQFITQQRVREFGTVPTNSALIDYVWVISPDVSGIDLPESTDHQPEYDPGGMGGYANSKRPLTVDPDEIEPRVTSANASPHGLTSAAASRALPYRLYLAPQLLEGTAPTKLPRNTTIDLIGSKVPLGWWQAMANGAFGLDVMFTPQGRVDRELLGEGFLHLRVADITDMTELARSADDNRYNNFNPFPSSPSTTVTPVVSWNPLHPGKLVTLVCQTGMLRISNVNKEGAGTPQDVPNLYAFPSGYLSGDPRNSPYFNATFGREAK